MVRNLRWCVSVRIFVTKYTSFRVAVLRSFLAGTTNPIKLQYLSYSNLWGSRRRTDFRYLRIHRDLCILTEPTRCWAFPSEELSRYLVFAMALFRHNIAEFASAWKFLNLIWAKEEVGVRKHWYLERNFLRTLRLKILQFGIFSV